MEPEIKDFSEEVGSLRIKEFNSFVLLIIKVTLKT